MRIKKLLAVSIISIMMFLLTVVSSYSEATSQSTGTIPDTIKVGLYYTYSSEHVSTALPSFTVNAASGLQAGFFTNNAFSIIYEEPSSSSITVRKDTYFTDAGGMLKEYFPQNGNTSAAGNNYGPYHLKAGGDLPDQPSALSQAALLKQLGLQAYPVYNDAWQVWIGSYTDQDSAAQDLTRISAIQGVGACTIIQPSATRIVVTDAQNQILCIFDSSSAYFRVDPKPENNPDVFSINGKKYRGALEVRRFAASDMTVINILKINEYLYGNVPPEIGGRSPAEALKAQAIASKMYAINNLGKHKKIGFDISPTTYDQVYKGYSSEVASCNTAIDQVADKVITYNGSLASEIFYFASSGGRTEDVQNVWGYPYPYLVSVDDSYDSMDTWTKSLRASDIKSRITGIGNILGMTITKTSPSGRVTELAVRGDQKADPKIYKLDNCRTFLSLDSQLYSIQTDADVYISSTGTSPVKTQLGGKTAVTSSGTKQLASSTNKLTVIGAGGVKKTVTLVPETYTFTGMGWGHGVGMSQEGAIGMGKAGIPYDQILTHYFQGTKIL